MLLQSIPQQSHGISDLRDMSRIVPQLGQNDG